MHILKDPSFFLTNHTVAPQGEELGLINLFSKSSCYWLDSSCISDGASLYDDHATGAALGTKSIRNFTWRVGGSPGKSSGKTSNKSRMIVKCDLPWTSGGILRGIEALITPWICCRMVDDRIV
ncbi:hypothetical protein Tco_0478691 [Tanacetum coccineum]